MIEISDVERVLVINLPERPDRWQEFCEEHATLDWPLPPPQHFPALAGFALRRPVSWQGSIGAWGCLQSWRAVLSDLVIANTRLALVLEDDATFASHFATKLRYVLTQVPADWRVVMLGGEHRARPQTVNSSIVRVKAAARTHALLINQVGAQELLAATLYAGDEVDGVFGAVQQGGHVYATSPFLVGQRASKSDVDGGHPRRGRFFNGLTATS